MQEKQDKHNIEEVNPLECFLFDQLVSEVGIRDRDEDRADHGLADEIKSPGGL